MTAVWMCPTCADACTPPIPAAKPVPERKTLRAPEMQRNGVALSAIGHVLERKPPEPWVPSCDDDYWLPDAGQ